MIDIINDEFGTDYEYEDPWTKVLSPETLPISPHGVAGGPGSPRAAPVDLGRLDSMLAADLPSEDEEDEDYQVTESESAGAGVKEKKKGKGTRRRQLVVSEATVCLPRRL